MECETPSPEPLGLQRAFTQRSSTARQRSINFMPSRQLSFTTLKQCRADTDQNSLLDELLTSEPQDQSPEQQADSIVKEMEQHQLLMEDNPEAEGRRRDALRDLPKGLTTKRSVRAKLSASVSMRSKHRPISLWKRLKYRVSFASKRTRDRLRNFIFSIEPWYEAIRKIEGNFGSAVGSYFYFLRWVVVFDMLLLALVVCFVVAPQVVHDGRVNGTERGGRGVLEFMSGMGAFENSLLFFGHYHAGDIASSSLNYNMTAAYFYTMCTIYLVFFAVLCYKTAYSYRVNFIETGGGLRHVYANKVFSGWDFGIATDRAAVLNHRSIYNELKELLSEQEKKSTTTPICIKLSHYLTNTIVTALVLAFIGGLEYGLWLLLRVEGVKFHHWELVVSAVVTIVICICPIIFSLFVKAEFYTPRVGLYVTLARTCLLDNTTLFILLFAAINKGSHNCWETSFGQETYRLVLLDALFSLIVLPAIEFFRGLVYKLHSKEDGIEFNIAYNSLTVIYTQCVLWFGMLFSPLLVVAVVLKFLCLFYVKRALAFYACVPARKVWRAAQTQTVMYMLVTVSSFVTLFGLGSIVLNYTETFKVITFKMPYNYTNPQYQDMAMCYAAGGYVLDRARQLYQQIRKGNCVIFIMARETGNTEKSGLIMERIDVQCVVYASILATGSSSQQCGPFKQYDYVYQIVTEGLLSLSERDSLRSTLVFITRPGVIAFVMLFLCVAVYYIRAKSQAQQSMVNILRQMLVLEAKDKDFLLTAISKVSNGEWLYNKGEILPPDSHTWKYLNDNNVRKPSNAEYHFDASRINHSILENSRINSSMPECSRPKSFARDIMSNSYGKERPESLFKEDGETDSSFSWQGSNTNIRDSDFESGNKKWI